jgi:hypothetical membrane protein
VPARLEHGDQERWRVHYLCRAIPSETVKCSWRSRRDWRWAVVALYSLLHLLRPDYNPFQRFLSEYAVGRFGGLMTAAFLLQALISLALVIGLFREVRHSGSLLAGCAFLIVAALTLTLAGVFQTDLSDSIGPFRLITPTGMLHQLAGAISFLSRIAAFLCLSRAYRFDNRWQSLAPTARHVAIAFLTLFFTFVLMIPWNFGGVAQRVTVAVGLLWILLSGLHLRRVSQVTTGVLLLVAPPTPAGQQEQHR